MARKRKNVEPIADSDEAKRLQALGRFGLFLSKDGDYRSGGGSAAERRCGGEYTTRHTHPCALELSFVLILERTAETNGDIWHIIPANSSRRAPGASRQAPPGSGSITKLVV